MRALIVAHLKAKSPLYFGADAEEQKDPAKLPLKPETRNTEGDFGSSRA